VSAIDAPCSGDQPRLWYQLTGSDRWTTPVEDG
jgi:hypothetical protein